MPLNNSKYMHSVYVKGEELFDQVRNVETEYIDQTAISKIDVEKQIEENFKSVEDWETNF